MGDVLNWHWPIEWDDGTACELAPLETDGAPDGLYFVRSEHEPRGWLRSTMPRLGLTNPIMVLADGTLDGYRAPGTPRIVNTQMPTLKTAAGDVPIGGKITNDGTRLTLTFEGGAKHTYSWPRLLPMGGAPRLIEITAKMVAAEAKAEEEREAMFDNPLFGAF